MKPILWLDLEQHTHKGEQGHPESPLRILAIHTAFQDQKQTLLNIRSDPIPLMLEPASSHSWTLDVGDTYFTLYP